MKLEAILQRLVLLLSALAIFGFGGVALYENHRVKFWEAQFHSYDPHVESALKSCAALPCEAAEAVDKLRGPAVDNLVAVRDARDQFAYLAWLIPTILLPTFYALRWVVVGKVRWPWQPIDPPVTRLESASPQRASRLRASLPWLGWAALTVATTAMSYAHNPDKAVLAIGNALGGVVVALLVWWAVNRRRERGG